MAKLLPLPMRSQELGPFPEQGGNKARNDVLEAMGPHQRNKQRASLRG